VVKRCPDGSWEVRLSLSSAKTESQLPARGAADPEKKPVEPAADKTYH